MVSGRWIVVGLRKRERPKRASQGRSLNARIARDGRRESPRLDAGGLNGQGVNVEDEERTQMAVLGGFYSSFRRSSEIGPAPLPKIGPVPLLGPVILLFLIHAAVQGFDFVAEALVFGGELLPGGFRGLRTSFGVVALLVPLQQS